MGEKSLKGLRVFYYEYRSEFVFGLLLFCAVVASYVLSPLIPSSLFRSIISPVQNTAIITVAVINTWAMARHCNGIRVRYVYAWIMAATSVVMIIGTGYREMVNADLRPSEGIFSFEGWELVGGDIFALNARRECARRNFTFISFDGGGKLWYLERGTFFRPFSFPRRK